jgi:hypothetical protein
MSEFVQGALVAGGFALAGAFATQIFNLFLERRREDASYRINLYDRRLAVHQQAFEWIHKLNVDLNYAKPGQLDAAETEQLTDTTRAARDWWNASALYLDPVSRAKLVEFLNYCFEYGRDDRRKGGTGANIWRLMSETLRAVEEGIGMKHIEGTTQERPHD